MAKYIVKPGDSPFRIAGKLYGDQRQAMALSGYMPQNLRPGMVLDLPDFRPGGSNPYISPTWMQSRLNQDAAKGLPYTQRPGFQQQAFTPQFDWDEYKARGGRVYRPAFWDSDTAQLYNTIIKASPGGVPGLDAGGIEALAQAYKQGQPYASVIADALPLPPAELIQPGRKIPGYNGPATPWSQDIRINQPIQQQYDFDPAAMSGQPGFDWFAIDEARRREILSSPDFDVRQYSPEAAMQMYGDPNFDWSKAPAWHKYYFDLAINNPVLFQSMIGAIGGSAAGIPGAVIGGAVGAAQGWAAQHVGYSPYRQFLDQVKPGEDAGFIEWVKYAGAETVAGLNVLTEMLEQVVGFRAQLFDDPGEVLRNPGAAWQAARLSYESMGEKAYLLNLLQLTDPFLGRPGTDQPLVGGVMAQAWGDIFKGDFASAEQILSNNQAARAWLDTVWHVYNGDLDRAEAAFFSFFADPRKNQDYILGQSQAVETFGGLAGVEALEEVRGRILNGENPSDIIAEYQDRYVGAALMDLVLQSAADPLNFAAPISAAAGENVARLTGRPALADSFRDAGSLIKGAEDFKVKAQNAMPQAEAARLTGFEKWLAGLDDAGTIKEMKPLDHAGKRKNFFNLDGRSRASLFIRNVKDILGVMFDTRQHDPLKTVQLFKSWASGDPRLGAEIGATFLDSPQAYALMPAMRGMDGMLSGRLAQWEATTPNRAILERVAELLGEPPAKIVDTMSTEAGARQQMTRLMERMAQSDDPAARDLLARIQSGELSPISLAENFKVFADDPQLMDARAWHIELLNAVEDHSYKWVEQAFKVSPDSPIFTMGNTLKAMQSLVLLGFSPGYLLTNVFNNEVTRTAWGAGGYISRAQGQKWLEKFGVAPSRLEAGVGPAEIGLSTTADLRLNDAVLGRGPLANLYRAVSGFGQKVGIAAKLSGAMEKQQSYQATVMMMRRNWNRIWKRGVGFEMLPPQVEARMRQGSPQLVDALYRMVEGSMSQADLSAMVGRALSQGIEERARVSELVTPYAERYGMTPEQAADMLEAAGITERLQAELDQATTSDERNRAFMDAADRAQDFAAVQQAAELAGMAEHTRNQIQAEGWPALRDIMSRFAIERAATWDNHHNAWEKLFSKRDETDPVTFNHLVKRRRLEARKEFARINRQDAATYKGIVEALGVDDAGNREILARLGELHNARRDFFDASARLWAELDRPFETSAEFWSAYNRIQAELDRLYADLIQTETSRQEAIDGRFVELMQANGIEMGGAADYFRQSRDVYTQRQLAVVAHKERIRKMKAAGVARRKIDAANAKFWSEFSRQQALEYGRLRTEGARSIGEPGEGLVQSELSPTPDTPTDNMGRPIERELTQQQDRPYIDDNQPMTNQQFTRLMNEYGGSDWLQRRKDYYTTRRQDSIPPEVVERAIARRDEARQRQMAFDEQARQTSDAGEVERLKALLEDKEAELQAANRRAEADRREVEGYKYDTTTGLPLLTRRQDELAAAKYFVGFDAQGLKFTNKRYGELAGDELMRAVGRAADEAGIKIFRDKEGGDEFYVLMDNADPKAAQKIAEDVRNALLNAILVVQDRDGNTRYLTGYDIHYGWGETKQQAEAAYEKRKQDFTEQLAAKLGKSADDLRGREPETFRELPGEGVYTERPGLSDGEADATTGRGEAGTAARQLTPIEELRQSVVNQPITDLPADLSEGMRVSLRLMGEDIIEGAPKSLHARIIELGGIDKTYAADILPDNWLLFRRNKGNQGGFPPDTMARILQDEGYLPKGDPDVTLMTELIQREAGGEKVFATYAGEGKPLPAWMKAITGRGKEARMKTARNLLEQVIGGIENETNATRALKSEAFDRLIDAYERAIEDATTQLERYEAGPEYPPELPTIPQTLLDRDPALAAQFDYAYNLAENAVEAYTQRIETIEQQGKVLDTYDDAQATIEDARTEAKELITAAEIEALLVEKFGYTEAQARRNVEILHARSKAWAQATGQPAEQWFRKIGDILGEGDALDGDVLAQAVYHGSPYKFDKFTTEKIGTGEGAQAFGWGLYFSSNKSVAEWYRSNLSGQWTYDGKPSNHFVGSGYFSILDSLAKFKDMRLVERAIDNTEAKIRTAESNIIHPENVISESTMRKDGDSWKVYNGKANGEYYSDRDRSVVVEWVKSKSKVETDNLRRIKTELQKIDVSRIAANEGQLYKAEIPDDSYLLWDKPLSEQPESVRAVLEKLDIGEDFSHVKGEVLYKYLVVDYDSDKAASLALHDAGIVGIKYLDNSSRSKGNGSYNYVVFDDNAVNILETYYQAQREGRIAGATHFLDNGQALIKAFEARDATTFMHEVGHVLRRDLYATSEMMGIDAPKWMLDDLVTMEKWAGAEDGIWTREAEEKFARGWEQYLSEGKAPTTGLQRVFDYFKQAMLDVYRQITGSAIDAGITDDVRAVFDRMLGSEPTPALDTGTVGGLLPGMQQSTGMLFDVQEGGKRTRMDAPEARSIYDVEPGKTAADSAGNDIKPGDIIRDGKGQQHNVTGVNRAGRIVTADNKLLNPADVQRMAAQVDMFGEAARVEENPDAQPQTWADTYRREKSSPTDGSWDMEVINNEAGKVEMLEVFYKPGEWREDFPKWEGAGDLARELVKLGMIDTAWDNTGKPYHARKGTPLPDWLSQSANDADLAGLPAKTAEPLVSFSPNDISYDLAYRAHSATSFVPEKRAASRQAEYVQHMQQMVEKFEPMATTPELRQKLSEHLQRYKAGYIRYMSDYLQAHSRVISSMITGPSNFPVRRAQKANAAADAKVQAFIEWSERAQKAIRRDMLPDTAKPITADNPRAVEIMQEKIDAAEKEQAMMRDANKIFRDSKLTPEEKTARLVELGVSRVQAIARQQPDFAGRIGYADYETKNNAANIRRMKERLTELQKAREKAASGQANEWTFEGGRIVENLDENRIQIIFEAKPDADIRAKLKKRGFRWAPSQNAWQRQLTNNATYDALQIFNAQKVEALPVADVDTVEVALPNLDMEADSPDTLMQIQEPLPGEPRPLFDAERKNLPPGSIDYLTSFRQDAGGWGELVNEKILPLLEDMRGEAEQQAGVVRAPSLDPATLREVQQWARKLPGQMGTAKYQTMKYAEAIRDRALLDYSRRYGWDAYANLVYPYQFWYTRSMVNWALMALDKPGLFAFYNRLQAHGEKYRKDLPERMRGRIKVPLSYLPDWAGDGIYIDPSKDAFPFSQFDRPVESVMRDYSYQQNNAAYVLRQWAESGAEDSAAVMQAMQTQSGPLWERAVAEAGNQREAEVGNPMDFVNAMLGPAWYLTTAANIAKGTPEKIFPTPMLRTGQAIETALRGTPMEWAGNLAGGLLAAPERWVREQADLSEFGEWGDYYIDRQLANMAADGEYPPEVVIQAMIERSGPVYDAAYQRVRFETMAKVPGALALYGLGRGNMDALTTLPLTMFSGQILPEGELRYSGLKEAWGFAWEQDKALQAKDPALYEANKRNGTTNVQKFLDKHPEYEARLSLRKDPQERLRNFMVSEIWDKYMALDKQDRRVVANQMGADFRDSFLDKNTRSYESIDLDTLALWSRMLGGTTPRTPETEPAFDVDMPPMPRVPDSVKPAINTYYQQRDQAYPGIMAIQEGYYSVPEESRRQYLTRFPILRAYWDWRQDWLEANPQAAPFVSQTVAGEILAGQKDYPYMGINELADLLDAYHNTPAQSGGVNYFDSLSPITQRIVVEYALTGKSPGLGAMKELKRIWEASGRPTATLDEFLALVAQGAK